MEVIIIPPIFYAWLAQLVRAIDLHSIGRRFESCTKHHFLGLITERTPSFGCVRKPNDRRITKVLKSCDTGGFGSLARL